MQVAAKKQTLKNVTDYITDIICKRAELGYNYGVILIPEGLIDFIPEVTYLSKYLLSTSYSCLDSELTSCLTSNIFLCVELTIYFTCWNSYSGSDSYFRAKWNIGSWCCWPRWALEKEAHTTISCSVWIPSPSNPGTASLGKRSSWQCSGTRSIHALVIFYLMKNFFILMLVSFTPLVRLLK